MAGVFHTTCMYVLHECMYVYMHVCMYVCMYVFFSFLAYT